jgi:hypothetical protein
MRIKLALLVLVLFVGNKLVDHFVYAKPDLAQTLLTVAVNDANWSDAHVSAPSAQVMTRQVPRTVPRLRTFVHP